MLHACQTYGTENRDGGATKYAHIQLENRRVEHARLFIKFVENATHTLWQKILLFQFY